MPVHHGSRLILWISAVLGIMNLLFKIPQDTGRFACTGWEFEVELRYVASVHLADVLDVGTDCPTGPVQAGLSILRLGKGPTYISLANAPTSLVPLFADFATSVSQSSSPSISQICRFE